jgi:hypothetical protein
MQILESRVEPAGPGLIRVVTLIDTNEAEPGCGEADPNLGEGPTGSAIPDFIVRVLIENLSAPSMSLAEIQRVVGGNPGTVNRQAWTLATNAPDLQLRLRGWVTSPERGRYALTAAARRRLANENRE